jgi:hypothetical protein
MITRSFDHRNEIYLTAIGIIPAAGGSPAQGKKYRRIRNQPAKIYRFELFLRRQYPAMTHVNYYGRRGKHFCFQHAFEDRGRFITRDTWRVPLPAAKVFTPAPVIIHMGGAQVYAKFNNTDSVHSLDLPELLRYFDQYVPW